MFRSIFTQGTPLVQIAVRCAVVYFAVLIGLRISGKREIGQIGIFDFVLILLIANAVQNAMTGPDVSLEGGLVAAATLIAINMLVSRSSARSQSLGRLVVGRRVPLVHDGRIDAAAMRRTGVSSDELETAVHEGQMSEISDVYEAYLEPDGQISVLPMSAKEQVTTTSNLPTRRAAKRRRVRQFRKH
jgi:uncharacterized membrane protein YcaP (DUF421 family)